MVLGLPTAPSAAALAAPRLMARAAAPAVGVAAGAVAGTARAGIRSADGAVRVARVARNAVAGSGAPWRSGARAHLALRPVDPQGARRAGGTSRPARRLAAALQEHPDVLLAYWDQGLGRLVVAGTRAADSDRVVDRAADLAARYGLTVADDTPEETRHPADESGVRNAVAALAADVVGTGLAVTAYVLRLPPSPRAVTAVVTLLREDPRFRALLRARLGRPGMDH